MLCVARVVDAQTLLQALLGRPELLPAVWEMRNGEKPGNAGTKGDMVEKPGSSHVFVVFFLPCGEGNYGLTNAKSTRGICAFL